MTNVCVSHVIVFADFVHGVSTIDSAAGFVISDSCCLSWVHIISRIPHLYKPDN